MRMMKNMLWMASGLGVGYLYSKYDKKIMKKMKTLTKGNKSNN